MARSPETTGRFQAGKSGNPRGRPAGRRHTYLAALDQVGLESAAAIVTTLSQKALAGDVAAASLLLARCWPPAKGRPLSIALPPVESAADVPRLLGLVVAAVAVGDLLPDEGAALSAMLTGCLRSYELADFDRRLAILEEAT